MNAICGFHVMIWYIKGLIMCKKLFDSKYEYTNTRWFFFGAQRVGKKITWHSRCNKTKFRYLWAKSSSALWIWQHFNRLPCDPSNEQQPWIKSNIYSHQREILYLKKTEGWSTSWHSFYQLNHQPIYLSTKPLDLLQCIDYSLCK